MPNPFPSRCSSDLNVFNGKFGRGGMEHQLSIGADYSHTVFKSTDLAGLVSSIDLYDPTYDAINKPEIIFTVYDNSSRQQFDSWGIFVQEIGRASCRERVCQYV